MDLNKTDICVFGLGYVGLTLAISLASKGHIVHGVEINDTILDSLDHGKAHFYEPKLDELIRTVIRNKTFTYSNCSDLDKKYSTYIITIGTPLDKDKIVNLSMIDRVTNQLCKIVESDSLVILRSTVKIGTTRKICQQFIDLCGYSPKLAYCPERTVEGAAMEELLMLPQIIGGIDNESTKQANAIFSTLTPTTIEVSSPESAEMVKLIDNVSRDTLFGLANEFAIACDELNLSASEIIFAGSRSYKRSILPLPGPVGGPCLEKDTYIYNQSFDSFIPRITLAGRHSNESLIEHAIRFIDLNFNPSSVAILGMAFKGEPPTSDLRGSVSLNLIKQIRLRWKNVSLTVYDQYVDHGELSKLDQEIQVAKTIKDAISNKNLVIIMNKTNELCNYNFATYLEDDNNVMYDFWGQQTAVYSDKRNYISFGSHVKYKL